MCCVGGDGERVGHVASDNLHEHEEDAEDAGDDELAPRLLVDAALAPDRVAVQVWRIRTIDRMWR